MTKHTHTLKRLQKFALAGLLIAILSLNYGCKSKSNTSVTEEKPQTVKENEPTTKASEPNAKNSINHFIDFPKCTIEIEDKTDEYSNEKSFEPFGYPVYYSGCELSKEFIQNMIDTGADVNQTNEYGQTALMLATDEESIELLIQNGADISKQDNFGHSFIDYAIGKEFDIPRLIQTYLKSPHSKAASINEAELFHNYLDAINRYYEYCERSDLDGFLADSVIDNLKPKIIEQLINSSLLKNNHNTCRLDSSCRDYFDKITKALASYYFTHNSSYGILYLYDFLTVEDVFLLNKYSDEDDEDSYIDGFTKVLSQHFEMDYEEFKKLANGALKNYDKEALSERTERIKALIYADSSKTIQSLLKSENYTISDMIYVYNYLPFKDSDSFKNRYLLIYETLNSDLFKNNVEQVKLLLFPEDFQAKLETDKEIYDTESKDFDLLTALIYTDTLGKIKTSNSILMDDLISICSDEYSGEYEATHKLYDAINVSYSDFLELANNCLQDRETYAAEFKQEEEELSDDEELSDNNETAQKRDEAVSAYDRIQPLIKAKDIETIRTLLNSNDFTIDDINLFLGNLENYETNSYIIPEILNSNLLKNHPNNTEIIQNNLTTLIFGSHLIQSPLGKELCNINYHALPCFEIDDSTYFDDQCPNHDPNHPFNHEQNHPLIGATHSDDCRQFLADNCPLYIELTSHLKAGYSDFLQFTNNNYNLNNFLTSLFNAKDEEDVRRIISSEELSEIQKKQFCEYLYKHGSVEFLAQLDKKNFLLPGILHSDLLKSKSADIEEWQERCFKPLSVVCSFTPEFFFEDERYFSNIYFSNYSEFLEIEQKCYENYYDGKMKCANNSNGILTCKRIPVVNDNMNPYSLFSPESLKKLLFDMNLLDTHRISLDVDNKLNRFAVYPSVIQQGDASYSADWFFHYDDRAVKEWLNQGREVNTTIEHGKTPIFYAVFPKEVELLIAAGADVNTKNNDGRTPLHYFTMMSSAFPYIPTDNVSDALCDTPIYRLIDYTAMIRILINAHANVNERDNERRTPLFYANREVAESLLDNGADVNAKDNEGKTPLHHLAMHWFHSYPSAIRTLVNFNNNEDLYHHDDDDPETIMKSLIDAHANVNERDNYGRTPLFYANPHNIRVLIENGANVNIRDNNGCTASLFILGTSSSDILNYSISELTDLIELEDKTLPQCDISKFPELASGLNDKLEIIKNEKIPNKCRDSYKDYQKNDKLDCEHFKTLVNYIESYTKQL